MTAKVRFVGKATPNENPRSANYALLMAQMAALESAGHNAIVELRGFGLHALADSLHAEVEKIGAIHTAAGRRIREVS